MSTNHHVADVLSRFLPEYRKVYQLTYQQEKACRNILACRSGQLGSQQWHCPSCDYERVVHCSCRDRHCPRCQGRQTQKWLEKQQEQILPVRYYHLVFTLPHELNVISQYAASTLYNSLFHAVWQTLSKFASNRRFAQGQLGLTGVLHTWGQNLSQHIHLHCLVPGGVLSSTGKWCEVKGQYLYPVKALSSVFRAKMLSELRAAKINVPNAESLMHKPWCVYCKPTLTRPESVIKYLSRYTHRGMLHESRLAEVNDDTVVFKYKDYRQPAQKKQMRLTGLEFIRRYLQHVLPKGFMRIRHMGYLANCCRRRKLTRIKLQCHDNHPNRVEKDESHCHWLCPECKKDMLVMRAIIPLDIATKVRPAET